MKTAFKSLFAKQKCNKVDKPRTSDLEPRILQKPQFIDSDTVDVVDFPSDLHGREIYSTKPTDEKVPLNAQHFQQHHNDWMPPNGTFLKVPQTGSSLTHGDEKKQIEEREILVDEIPAEGFAVVVDIPNDIDDEFEKYRIATDVEEVSSKYGMKSEETCMEEKVREIKTKFVLGIILI